MPAFRCHSCQARLKAPLKMLGELRPCPRCRKPVRVRITLPEDAGPALVRDKKNEETAVIPSLARANSD